MSLDYINEAFRSLESLNEDIFSVDHDGINELSDFMSSDVNDEEKISIIDMDAETEDDLQDSYVGKIICDCNVCHSHVFKDKDQITIDEEGVVDIEDDCPYCGEHNGFVIIGEITEFNPNAEAEEEVEETPADAEEEEVTEESEDEEAEEEALDESLTEAKYAISNEELEKLTAEDVIRNRNGKTFYSEPDATGYQVGISINFRKAGSRLSPYLSYRLEKDCWTVHYAGEAGAKEFETFEEAKAELISAINAQNTIARDSKKDESLNEEAPRKFKPHTMKLLKMIGSDLANDAVEEKLEESSDMEQIPEMPSVKGKKVRIMDRFGRADGDAYLVVDEFPDEVKYNGDHEVLLKAPNGVNFRANRSRVVPVEEKLDESFNNVSIETDDQKMTMTSEENGKVTVTTEPIEAAPTAEDGEMIAPISDETKDEIINATAEVVDEEPAEETAKETPAEEEEMDFDFDELDEEGMDELGESYLKRVYENVDSFKTSNVSTSGNKLFIEGVINFKSGASKKTGFIFEAKEATRDGKVKFMGENAHLCRGKRAFTLAGSLNENKLMVESLTYNYRAKNSDGKSTRVYGTISRNK